MSDTSRRKFLAATGAGAAAGTVALTTGSASAATASPRHDAAKLPVVAYLEDHWSDTVRLMHGEHEVVVHDRDLAVRIRNAAGGAR